MEKKVYAHNFYYEYYYYKTKILMVLMGKDWTKSKIKFSGDKKTIIN